MQCRLPRMQTTIIQTFNVVLSGTFGRSQGYVTIDGTEYTSKQTLTVAKGTSVTVYCGSSNKAYYNKTKIKLNGTIVAQGGDYVAAKYTFAVTDNCTIVLSKNSYANDYYYTATITMPA